MKPVKDEDAADADADDDAEEPEVDEETLDLTSNGVSDFDVVLLAVLLQRQTDITAVHLQGNKLSGVAASALAQTIENTPTLEYVSSIPVRSIRSCELRNVHLRACNLGDM